MKRTVQELGIIIVRSLQLPFSKTLSFFLLHIHRDQCWKVTVYNNYFVILQMKLKKNFCFHGATEICMYHLRMHMYSWSRCLVLGFLYLPWSKSQWKQCDSALNAIKWRTQYLKYKVLTLVMHRQTVTSTSHEQSRSHKTVLESTVPKTLSLPLSKCGQLIQSMLHRNSLPAFWLEKAYKQSFDKQGRPYSCLLCLWKHIHMFLYSVKLAVGRTDSKLSELTKVENVGE